MFIERIEKRMFKFLDQPAVIKYRISLQNWRAVLRTKRILLNLFRFNMEEWVKTSALRPYFQQTTFRNFPKLNVVDFILNWSSV